MLHTDVLKINRLGRVVHDRSFVVCLMGRTVVLPIDFEIERPVFGCPAPRPSAHDDDTSTNQPCHFVPRIIFACKYGTHCDGVQLPSSSTSLLPTEHSINAIDSQAGGQEVRRTVPIEKMGDELPAEPSACAPLAHVADIYFTATVTCNTVAVRPVFTITRSDDPARYVYTSDQSASAAWHAALLQACADFPERTHEIIPGRGKCIATVDGLMLYGLQYTEVDRAVRLLPGATAMLQRFAALDCGNSNSSTSLMNGNTYPSHLSTSDAVCEDDTGCEVQPCAVPVTAQDVAETAQSCTEKERMPYMAPVTYPSSMPLPRSLNGRQHVTVAAAAIGAESRSGSRHGSDSSTPPLPAPQMNGGQISPAHSLATSPSIAPVPVCQLTSSQGATAAAPLLPLLAQHPTSPPHTRSNSRARALSLSLNRVPGQVSYVEQNQLNDVTCSVCGLTNTPFCAVTGEAHPRRPPPCAHCGLTSAFCPITGQPHFSSSYRTSAEMLAQAVPPAIQSNGARRKKTKKPSSQQHALDSSADGTRVVHASATPSAKKRTRGVAQKSPNEGTHTAESTARRRRQSALPHNETESQKMDKSKPFTLLPRTRAAKRVKVEADQDAAINDVDGDNTCDADHDRSITDIGKHDEIENPVDAKPRDGRALEGTGKKKQGTRTTNRRTAKSSTPSSQQSADVAGNAATAEETSAAQKLQNQLAMYPPLRSPLGTAEQQRAATIMQRRWKTQDEQTFLPVEASHLRIPLVPQRRFDSGAEGSKQRRKQVKLEEQQQQQQHEVEDANETQLGSAAGISTQSAEGADQSLAATATHTDGGADMDKPENGDTSSTADANDSDLALAASGTKESAASPTGRMCVVMAHPLEVRDLATSLVGKRYMAFMLKYTSERAKQEMLRTQLGDKEQLLLHSGRRVATEAAVTK